MEKKITDKRNLFTSAIIGVLLSFPVTGFIYGFSACSLLTQSEIDSILETDVNVPEEVLQYATKLLVFGGCTEGGYGGDVNDCYVVDLKFTKTAASSASLSAAGAGELSFYSTRELLQLLRNPDSSHVTNKIIATFSENLTGGDTAAITRAYHSSNIILYNNERTMIVFGGLHEHQSCNSLQMLDIRTNSWSSPIALGTPPSARFGHSDTYHPSLDKLIICSGSDGNDLTRNGRELRDIHILSIIRGSPQDGDSLVWSTPVISPEISKCLPGRCHSAGLCGNKIFFFGGGARNSADMSVYDIVSETAYRPKVYIDESEELPIRRVSSVGLQIGTRFFIHGGWSNQARELGDLWSVDLSYSSAAVSDDTVEMGTSAAPETSASTGNKYLDFVIHFLFICLIAYLLRLISFV